MASLNHGTVYPQFKRGAASSSEEHEIARVVIKAIRRYFAQPGVQERFEAWLKAQGKTVEMEASE